MARHGEVEAAGQEQERIMERLGIEPLAVHAPEQAVVGVGLRRLRP